MLDGLRDLGKTIFLTTHYMEEAERLADRIAVIAGGRIIDEGTPATIGHRDLAASEIIFDAARRDRRGRPARGPAGAGRSRPRRDGRIELHSAAPLADLGRLGSWAEGRGIEVGELEVHRPTLEDVYLRLTAEAAGVADEEASRDGPGPARHPLPAARLPAQQRARMLTLVIPLILLALLAGVFHGGETDGQRGEDRLPPVLRAQRRSSSR